MPQGRQNRAYGAEVLVSGWPERAIDTSRPPAWLGDDPIFGRLACPPYSRLNLKRGSSEGLIFKSVNESKKRDGQVAWSFKIKSGIYWWDGSEVTPLDVANYMQREISEAVKAKGLGLWQLPSYKTSASGPYVLVSWASPPPFGPYILNGRSFWTAASEGAVRESGGFRYQCAGVYRPKLDQNGFHLLPTKGYRMRRKPLYLLHKERPSLANIKQQYQFQMAETFSGNPLVRPPEAPGKCSNKVDLPMISVISWNLKKPYLQEKKLRYLLTQLTPRGSLLRSGAGHAGGLISSFVPRNHPAYDSRLLVRPFNLLRSARELDKLGFRRPKGDGPRYDRMGKPLNLKIASVSKDLGLVEKVVSDSYMAVGIRAEFVHYNKESAEDFDGVLTGLRLPWPSMDVGENFHSRFAGKFPFWSIASKELDTLIEKYAIELTQKRPNFVYLRKILRHVFDQEPFSVLMQHSICLKKRGGAVARSVKIDNRDPDWFRRVIL